MWSSSGGPSASQRISTHGHIHGNPYRAQATVPHTNHGAGCLHGAVFASESEYTFADTFSPSARPMAAQHTHTHTHTHAHTTRWRNARKNFGFNSKQNKSWAPGILSGNIMLRANIAIINARQLFKAHHMPKAYVPAAFVGTVFSVTTGPVVALHAWKVRL